MATQWQDSDWALAPYMHIQLVEVIRSGNWLDPVVVLGQHDDSKTREEIDYLHKRVAERTGPRRQDILDQDQTGGILATFSKHFKFDEATKRQTVLLVRSAVVDGAVIVFYAKNLYRRLRPNQLDPSLITPGNHIIDVPGHPAYPSGHSFQSHLVARALAEIGLDLVPLTNLAKSIAENREIAGLHYPSDSRAGELLAERLWPVLMASAHMKKTLQNARKEWP